MKLTIKHQLISSYWGCSPFKIWHVSFILIVLHFLTTLATSLWSFSSFWTPISTHQCISYLALLHWPNYISTIFPKMACNFLLGNKSISFIGCGMQSFFMTLAGTEALWHLMAYDRYVAICFPLHYSIRISRSVCVGDNRIMDDRLYQLWAHTIYVFQIILPNLGPLIILDVPAMLTLACIDTWIYEYTVFECHLFPSIAFHWYCQFL